jgi:steroid 5-alpha reductase family enzyme
VERRRK